jgi:biopolymer transport protein ExbB/TolQ
MEDYSKIFNLAGNLIYVGLFLVAVWGVFCVVLLIRRIAKKGFRDSQAESTFIQQVRSQLRAGDYEQAIATCQEPSYSERAVAQLAVLALQNRNLGLAKLRPMLAERFERDVLAELQYGLSWINTVVKAAPMLGLLGTVFGMIGAFGSIAGAKRGNVDHTAFAGDIGLALYTTAIGLVIAIPLVLCTSLIVVRMRRLESTVEEGVSHFLDELGENELAPQRAEQYSA